MLAAIQAGQLRIILSGGYTTGTDRDLHLRRSLACQLLRVIPTIKGCRIDRTAAFKAVDLDALHLDHPAGGGKIRLVDGRRHLVKRSAISTRREFQLISRHLLGRQVFAAQL